MNNFEQYEQRQKYKDYINEHITNVQKVFQKVKKSLMVSDIEELSNKISYHDHSKFDKCEFNGYRQYFYPTKKEISNKEFFDISWNHHQKLNSHHWEYWCLIRDKNIISLEMDDHSLIEMLCDWTAMSVKFDNLPSKWFEENKKNMVIHPSTITKIEKSIDLFDDAYEEIKNEN